ncbi:MAG: hypothetical protein NTW03_21130, partial [Verrucomicrobia bacterium]|nr:hypothetical protein [Verrucomicrobiota bacterium]
MIGKIVVTITRVDRERKARILAVIHFASRAVFGVHPSGCPRRANTLKRGHRTGWIVKIAWILVLRSPWVCFILGGHESSVGNV